MKLHTPLGILAAGLALGLMTGASACRTTHLGPDTAGHTYRAALAAQRTGDETVEPPELSATDAKQVLEVHRTGETKGSASEGSMAPMGSMTSSSSSSSSGSGGGAWQGASGNISLEAK